MTDETQAKHAELYLRVAHQMAVQAGQLVSLAGDVKLSPSDVAKLFIVTGYGVAGTEAGHAAAIAFLRQLADDIEAGTVQPPAVN